MLLHTKLTTITIILSNLKVNRTSSLIIPITTTTDNYKKHTYKLNCSHEKINYKKNSTLTNMLPTHNTKRIVKMRATPSNVCM